MNFSNTELYRSLLLWNWDRKQFECKFLALKKSFLWIFFCVCGLDNIAVRVLVVDYIYILLHVCWVVQRMNDAEGFSLCLCERKMGGQRDRKTCTHIPVFQSNCPSIFLFALVFLCIFACLHLSVSLFLSFPCPPPPTPHQAPSPPSPFFVFEFLSKTVASSFKCCLMSSDVGWHIRDKLRPIPEHGSVLLYDRGNHNAC